METLYAFWNLPLLTAPDGFSAMLTDGEAIIEYDAEGHWRVRSITVTLGKTILSALGRPLRSIRQITPPKPIAEAIELTLLTDRRENVQAWVNEALEVALRPPKEPAYRGMDRI